MHAGKPLRGWCLYWPGNGGNRLHRSERVRDRVLRGWSLLRLRVPRDVQGVLGRGRNRRQLLKIYGLIEGGIGLYAIIFHFYFRALQGISFRAPDMLVSDIGIALAVLFLPTFLMGAEYNGMTALRIPASCNSCRMAE